MKIDGKDIRQEYGCMLLEGSYDDVFKYPSRESVTYNNWAEEDGIDPDVSEVKLKVRSISLSFEQSAGSYSEFWDLYQHLISDLTAPGYRSVEVIPGLILSLRLKKDSMYSRPIPFNAGTNLTTFTLEFVEDKTAISFALPSGGINLKGMYQINGKDFGEYGICSDQDAGEVMKYPDIKDPFTDGKTVYLDTLQFTHIDFRLSLWMYAKNESEFLNNWRAFFSEISKSGLQDLYINSTGQTVSVYYSDCTSFTIEKWGTTDIAARFTIVFVCPVVTWIDKGGVRRYRVLRDKGTNSVLADEQGRVIAYV